MAITQLVAYVGNPIFKDESGETRERYLALTAFIVAHKHLFGTVTLDRTALRVELRGEQGIIKKRVTYAKNADVEWVLQTLLKLTDSARMQEARKVDKRLHQWLDVVEQTMKTRNVTLKLEDDTLIATYKGGELRALAGKYAQHTLTHVRINQLIERCEKAAELQRLRNLAKKNGLL